MKKLLSIMLSLSLVLGLIGCSNGNLPEQESKEFSVKLNGDNNIEFAVPNKGKLNLWLYRKTKDSKDFTNYAYCYNPEQNNVSKLVDYFVNPDTEYDYYFGWYEGNTRKTSKTFTIKAKKGLGELEIVNSPSASYDKNTGIMNFSEMPKVSSQIQSFINNDIKSNFYIEYFKDAPRLWLGTSFTTPELNLSQLLASNLQNGYAQGKPEDFYDTEFKFNSLYVSIYVNNIEYKSSSLDNAKQSNLPKTVIIPDTSESITLENTTEGVKIILPESFKNYTNIEVGRKDVNDPSDNGAWWGYIKLTNYKDSVTDYFVDQGKTYQYIVRGDDKNKNKVSTKLATIESTSGVADLVALPIPEGTFANNKMTFTNTPVVKDSVKAFFKQNKDCYSYINLVYMTQDRGSRACTIDLMNISETNKTIDCNFFQDDYNKDLDIYGEQASFCDEKNGIEFYRTIRLTNPKNLPKVIRGTK